MSNSPIWPIDSTLSGATTPGQNGSGSNGNEEVLHIPQSSSITGASPSDYLVSYIQDTRWGGGLLPLCRDAVGVFYSPSWLRWPACMIIMILIDLNINTGLNVMPSQHLR